MRFESKQQRPANTLLLTAITIGLADRELVPFVK